MFSPHISFMRLHGKSIDLRPAEVAERIQFGHWESDTVVGQKKRAVAFAIVERLTGYMSYRSDSRENDTGRCGCNAAAAFFAVLCRKGNL
jgi:IS30 family transposase